MTPWHLGKSLIDLDRKDKIGALTPMANRLWWVNPSGLLVFMILPLFVLSAFIGAPLMPQFGIVDFLTPATIALGGGCICTMAVGAMVGSTSTVRLDPKRLSFDEHRFDQLLVALLWLAVVVHLLFFAPVLLRPSLMWAVLTGQKGAVFIAKVTFLQVIGITSLANIAPLVLCMCSVRFVSRGKLLPSRIAAVGFALLVPLIVLRAFVNAERIALIENSIGLLLPIFSFSPRFRTIGQFVPLAAAVAVLIIFALGEYTRSWPYYRNYYDSFEQFAGLRLLAYVAGASNAGAGLVTTMPPSGLPLVTGRWFTRMPGLIGIDSSYYDSYFRAFGNYEFNNPSGIFAPIMDFGPAFGAIYIFVFGLFIGLIYGSYKRGHPVGLLCYPVFYVGLADLTQVWYWGEPRFIPELLFLAIVIGLCVRRRVLLLSA